MPLKISILSIIKHYLRETLFIITLRSMYKLQIDVSKFFSFPQDLSSKHFVPYYAFGEEQKVK